MRANPSNDEVIQEAITRLTTLSTSLLNAKPLSEYDEAFGDPVVVTSSSPRNAASSNGSDTAHDTPSRNGGFVDPLTGVLFR